jgi:hypothetical protein
MSITLEVKVSGKIYGGRCVSTRQYEVVWLDWDQFKILPAKRTNSHRHLVSNGHKAFDILRGKAREKYLRENNYDPNEVYANAPLN